MMNDTIKEFFPTSEELIDQMLSGIKWRMVKTVLDPSAGKGDLVEAAIRKAKERYYNIDADCIEINPDLRAVLKGRGYRVIHDDFLTYFSEKEYDLIIMNPPFSNGSKHLLKAIEMQKRNGGAIVCLLNAETIRNPYTNERKTLVRLLDEYGAEISYLENAFCKAERTTDVEVAMIKVKLPEVERASIILDNLKKAKEQQEFTGAESDYLVENDFVKTIIEQYNMEVSAGVEFIKEYKALAPHILHDFKKKDDAGLPDNYNGCILRLNVGNSEATVNEFVRCVRTKYWNALFRNPKFTGNMTSNLYEQYNAKVSELADYEFNLYNICEIKIGMINNLVKGIEDAIIDLFDELSHKYHYYDESSNNVHYYNGWKSNKSYIISQKVVIPLNGFRTSYYDNKKQFDPDYNTVKKLVDIEKCLNYLDGGLTEGMDLKQIIDNAKETGQTSRIRLKYFDVTFYKKGTCHITFTNLELLKKFNIFGSQKKGWLPPTYGKRKYKDMTAEEQEVIREFQGEADYERVMRDPDYYIVTGDNLLKLEMAG